MQAPSQHAHVCVYARTRVSTVSPPRLALGTYSRTKAGPTHCVGWRSLKQRPGPGTVQGVDVGPPGGVVPRRVGNLLGFLCLAEAWPLSGFHPVAVEWTAPRGSKGGSAEQ